MNQNYIITVLALTLVLLLGALYYIKQPSAQSYNAAKEINPDLEVQRPDDVLDEDHNAQIILEVGEDSAQLIIDTQSSAIQAYDIIINYDPSQLVITNQTLKITKDNPFSNIITNKINPTGEILLSAISQSDETFSGRATIATFSYTPNNNADKYLQIIYDGKGESNDSNIVSQSSATDILGSVTIQ